MSSESFRTTRNPARDTDAREERLRAAGLKVTAQRLAILSLLEGNTTHPSAHRVLEVLKPRYPSLSLSTVYETLEAFLEAGLCRAVAGEGALLRVDGTTFPHDHAACRGCGRIFDVAPDLWAHPEPPSRLPGGLKVIDVRVEYEVVCPTCARAAAGGAPRREHPGPVRAGRGADGHPRSHRRKKEV
jgi:Fur family peroxide stress response transcriptional regulator